MKFCTNSSFLLVFLGSSGFAAAEKSGRCVSGEGEFAYGGVTEAHFSLHACMEDEETSNAFGDLYTGQINHENDKFHYFVHCMDIVDDSTIFIGTEIKQLSKYVETYQDPESFRKSLIDGDRHTIMKYEQKIHKMQLEKNPAYLPALLALLKDMDVTLEQYEKMLEYEVANDRKLAYSDKIFYNYIVPLTTTCAKRLVVGSRCDIDSGVYTADTIKSLGNSTETFTVEDIQEDEQALKDLVDKSFEEALDEVDGSSLLADDERLETYCELVAIMICHYGCDLDLLDAPGCGGDRKLTANEGNEVQGTLALFKVTMPIMGQDEASHTIGVKLDHDFDISCKNFHSSIDHDFFTDKNVDVLTKGIVELP